MSVLGQCPYMVLSPSLSIGDTAFPAALPTLLQKKTFGTALKKPNAPLLSVYRAGHYMLQQCLLRDRLMHMTD